MLHALYNYTYCITFIGGNLAYGAVPVANSKAVIPRLQMSAFSLYPIDYTNIQYIYLLIHLICVLTPKTLG